MVKSMYVFPYISKNILICKLENMLICTLENILISKFEKGTTKQLMNLPVLINIQH